MLTKEDIDFLVAALDQATYKGISSCAKCMDVYNKLVDIGQTDESEGLVEE